MIELVLTIGWACICIAAVFVGMACIPVARVRITFWRVGRLARKQRQQQEGQWRKVQRM